MRLADKKYKTLKIKGTWNAPSQEEENILALNMEIDKLKQFRKETPSAHQEIREGNRPARSRDLICYYLTRPHLTLTNHVSGMFIRGTISASGTYQTGTYPGGTYL